MPADLQKARELFLHAVGQLPPEQWDPYIAAACGGDADLRKQVEHLLQVHREAGSFLERPAEGLRGTGPFTPAPADAATVPDEGPGAVIGPYKLVQQLGEGGMGTVWMAQQTRPVKRLVALKVIKPGMDSGQVIARFEAERQALAIRPDLTSLHVFIGAELRHQGDLAGAAAEYRQGVALPPNDPDFHYNLGNLLSQQSRWHDAAAAYRQAIALRPGYAEAHNKLGMALRWTGNRAGAADAYRQAIALRPDYAEAHHNLGSSLRDRAGAVAAYRQAILLKPKDFWYHFDLGNALDRQGDFAGAVAEFRNCIALQPDSALAHENLGNGLSRQGKLDEAIACFRKAIELDPNGATAHNNLGIALDKQGKLDEAIACYRKAIELDPKYAPAHANLGSALNKQGKLDEAVAAYRRAIELDPKDANAWRGRGLAYSNLGQYDKALADCQAAVKLAPTHAGDHNELAWLLATCPEAKLRDPDRAVELAKKATELAPKEGGYWNTLGVAHYRAGDWKAAVAALEKSRELNKGGDAADWLFLAMAHRKLGNEGESHRAYEQALRWLEQNREALSKDRVQADELRRFRSEAEEVLGLEKK